MDSSDTSKMFNKSNESSATKLQLVLNILAVTFALIALVVALVSLTHKADSNITINPTTGAGASANQLNDNKIWTMAIGHTASTRTEYIDEVSGQIKGFNVDIVNAVCNIANKNCRLVADMYQNCWDATAGEVQHGGVGLFNGYYDACTAWSHSYVRSRTFQFSNPFTKKSIGVFVVKPGNPDGFDWQNLSGKKIGFIDGFIHDEFCIAREKDTITGVPIAMENIVHYNGRDELIAGVLAGDVDAGFDDKEEYSNSDSLDVVSKDITSCALSGNSMIMRKESTMADWFNPALERIMATTEYRTICNDLQEQHGHKPGPDPVDVCIGLK